MATLTLFTLAVLLTLGMPCSPPHGWVPMAKEELLLKYDIVLLGTLMDADEFPFPVLGAEKTFEIFCVMKGDGRPVPRKLIVEDPPNPCVGIPMTIGRSFIMGLSRVNDTTFTWWKDAGIESVLFDYSKANMDESMKMCDFQDPKLPTEAQQIPVVGNKTCPVISDSDKDLCSSAPNIQIGVFSVALSLLVALFVVKI